MAQAWDGNSIRKAFLDFFQQHDHQIVPSAPMVIKDDPTLMFTNAGMNQFKEYILGVRPAPWPRACDAQKCLRVSGKQNDLEEVGHDTYHHTMFEMLGNWSFGNYFKQEVIGWAWELLTKVYGIDPSKLYATVFEGSTQDGIPRDQEALEYWKQYLPEDHILLGSLKDNFWEMGDTGPCGPCSEIHIDLRDPQAQKNIPGASLVNKDHPRVIEIWNLVFMQYNRKADGHLEPLPLRCVDTGMGLERLCMVLQGKESNYDTDIFQTLIADFARRAGVSYHEQESTDVALRVVADHLRAVAFAIADGQLPSNNKAGYVIRRILRRAVRYGYSFLGFRTPFLCDGVGPLIATMGSNYPELQAQQRLIESVIREEEAAFLRTLQAGLQLLQAELARCQREGRTQLEGSVAFTLYDTFGFPRDLTELMLREKGFTLDAAGFEQGMAEQKARSRQAATVVSGDWVELRPQKDGTEFVGYDQLETPAHIVRMRTVEQHGTKQYQLVLDRSPFYAESGGQVGDKGSLTSPNEKLTVLDTLKENNQGVLVVDHLPESPTQEFQAQVDSDLRARTACHHTATHLLHYALRQVLGSHVEQKGSLVEPTHLRFDFSHFQKMQPEELQRVEHMVNALVRAAYPREEFRDVPIAQARQMGAMALFGEKYGDHVRVLRYGPSTEFCGGTHVANTGNIGFFKILSEGAISAGVRRIEAIAGRAAEEWINHTVSSLEAIDTLLHAQGKPQAAVVRLAEENQALRREVEQLRAAQLAHQAAALYAEGQQLPEGILVVKRLQQMNPEQVKALAMAIRSQGERVATVLCSDHDGKPTIAVALSDSLVQALKLHAGQLVRELAKLVQGGGGGQPGFAQAGGKNAEGLEAVVSLAEKTLTSKLSGN